MKKILLLLAFAFTFIMAFAVNPYQNFLVEGKTWNCRYDNMFTGLQYNLNYFIKGDTLIGGKSCKKMYVSNIDNNGVVGYSSAWYEEGEKVYCIYNGATNATLMYDFGLKVGDSVELFFEEPKMPVKKIDTLTIDNISRRVVHFYEPYPVFCWIEGIGSENGPECNSRALGWDISLVSCTQDGQLLFSDEDFLKVLGIPKVVVGQECVTEISRYSLDGRCLDGPQKGVNIVKYSNGEVRKVLVK